MKIKKIYKLAKKAGHFDQKVYPVNVPRTFSNLKRNIEIGGSQEQTCRNCTNRRGGYCYLLPKKEKVELGSFCTSGFNGRFVHAVSIPFEKHFFACVLAQKGFEWEEIAEILDLHIAVVKTTANRQMLITEEEFNDFKDSQYDQL